MLVKLSTAVRTAMAEAIVAQIDAGSGPATLKFYTGTQISPGASITDQVLLGVLVCSDPCAVAADGEIEFEDIAQEDGALASGEVAWAMLEDSDEVDCASFDVTNNAGAGAIKVNTTTVVVGGPIAMANFKITMPGA